MSEHGPELVGRRFTAAKTFTVTAEQISKFARAFGYQGVNTPPTFLIRLSITSAEEFLPALGFDWSRVVHGDQKFMHIRGIRAGDQLACTSEIESVKRVVGNEFVRIRSDFSEISTGKKVSSSWSTLVFRGN